MLEVFMLEVPQTSDDSIFASRRVAVFLLVGIQCIVCFHSRPKEYLVLVTKPTLILAVDYNIKKSFKKILYNFSTTQMLNVLKKTRDRLHKCLWCNKRNTLPLKAVSVQNLKAIRYLWKSSYKHTLSPKKSTYIPILFLWTILTETKSNFFDWIEKLTAKRFRLHGHCSQWYSCWVVMGYWSQGVFVLLGAIRCSLYRK